MKTRVLFIVSTDPRTSPRAAEAVRIAAGVGAWGKVEVSMYLRGPAVLALSEEPDGLVDEENFVRFLPLLNQPERPVYVEEASPLLKQLGQPVLNFKSLSDEQLAALSAQQTYLLRF